jgi:DnaJ-class molecular chaperone
MDYWDECIRNAFDEAEIEASEDQIKSVVEAVEGAFENYGMAHGYDTIKVESDVERKYKELKKEIEDKEAWINETDPCKVCHSEGAVLDGWGRLVTCPNCNGAGRVKKTY